MPSEESQEHVLSKDNPDFVKLVDALGSASGLTIVAGAGVSIEGNLPTWKGLLRNLLHAGLEIENRGLPERIDTAKLADQIVERNGVVVAASVARLLHGAQRDAAIQRALYYGLKEAPTPGRIARAISLLVHLIRDVRIVTTNYDLLLEEAIRQTMPDTTSRTPLTIVPTITPDPVDEAIYIPIYHIHGVIPFPGDGEIVGPVVLDEQDFALASVRPPGQILPSLLSGGPVLHVGASLVDPNLVATLHILRESGNPQRNQYGLFVRETGAQDLGETVQQLMSDRHRSMAVEPLHLISYGQISQVLHEAIVRRDVGSDSYWSRSTVQAMRYGHRFVRWRKALQERWRYDDEDFQRIQDEIHSRLADFADRVRNLVAHGSGERFGLHLWVRQPGPGLGSLELWGSSVHLHREEWSLRAQSVVVEAGTSYPAVDAVYFGARQTREKSPNKKDRWQAMLAAPIELSADPWRNLIVGAITLSSNKELGVSGLRVGRNTLWADLQSMGADLLGTVSS